MCCVTLFYKIYYINIKERYLCSTILEALVVGEEQPNRLIQNAVSSSGTRGKRKKKHKDMGIFVDGSIQHLSGYI